ncbi:MAG: sigma-70 family RNA polymerase sigma factor [Phycisphaerales bacterium]|nr:sigma-70 family RNA polymerase sigma factor [Phycisphaerales bacterium]
MAAYPKNDEARLIRLAAAGDRAAAGALIQAHQHSLFAYLLRMSGRPDMAEDIAQEAFVRVLSNLDRFDPRFRFSTWLFTIARRLYVNANQKLRPAYDTDAVSARRSADDAPEAPVDRADGGALVRGCLDDALQGLSEDQREVIVLFHQLDWPISVIAAHMDMPEGTVKSHLHRGRQRLRELMTRDARFAAHESGVRP